MRRTSLFYGVRGGWVFVVPRGRAWHTVKTVCESIRVVGLGGWGVHDRSSHASSETGGAYDTRFASRDRGAASRGRPLSFYGVAPPGGDEAGSFFAPTGSLCDRFRV